MATDFLGVFMQGDTVYLEATDVVKYEPTTGLTTDLTSATSVKFRLRVNGGTGSDITATQQGSDNTWYGEYVCATPGDVEFYCEMVELGKTSRTLMSRLKVVSSF